MKKIYQKNKYSFLSGKSSLKFKTAVITGVGRSGKTTLGNLLATNRNVEYADEPWILQALPIMVKLKMISEEAGRGMFSAYLGELANDMILLRQANFRPDDLSSIWTKKTQAEIFSRLISLQSRSDVKNFIRENKPLFLLALNGDPAFNLPVTFDFLPDCKIIYMVRRGIDVAYQVKEKKWLPDKQLIHPSHAKIYRPITYKGRIFYMPCWVESKDDKKFIEYSEYERGLFYWCVLVESAIKSLKNLKEKKRYKIVKYEELMKNSQKIMREMSVFLNIKPSSAAGITKTALRKIKNYQRIYKKAPKLPEELLVRTKALYKYLKYGWN